jgi:hypothetical protein
MAKGNPKALKPPPQKVAHRPVAKLPERDGLDRRPFFSLQHADRGSQHDFHFRVDEESDSHALLSFLRDIGANSWAELRAQTTGGRQAHKKHHEMSIEDICEDAQQRLAAMKLDEVVGDNLFRFRLSGTQRLWGFITDNTFHVLWWDPEHKVYPVGKD